jgi:hypothetical protein
VLDTEQRYTDFYGMETLEQCVKGLVALQESDSVDLARKVDAIVDPYVAGFGRQTRSMRDELANAFHTEAPPTELSARIWLRILRDEP